MFSEAADTFARQVDTAFLFILGVSVFMLVLITVLMVFFVIRYSRKRNPVPENIEGNLFLEIVWTVVPTFLVLGMFYFGWAGYWKMQQTPKNALPVQVTARMWSWNFRYANGKESDVLYLPVGRPVKLDLTSEDVLHSFYVPAFRVKKDAVPGTRHELWFTPDEVGDFDIFCAEYCGTGHSSMLSMVKVLPQARFQTWLEGKGGGERSEKGPSGKDLLRTKGCLGCHSLDGSRLVGPSFKGMFGRTERVVTQGRERSVRVDEAYIRRSLLEPQTDIVVGYPPIMPPQRGRLTEEEVTRITGYLKQLK